MNRRIGAAFAAVVLSCATIGSGPALAQEKSAVRDGLTLPAGSVRILLVRPGITVGEQSTGGMFEPNADWTEQARRQVATALSIAQTKLGNEIVTVEEPVGPAAERLADYRALFSVVAESVVVYKFFPGNRLPSKKRQGVFDWTLGPGVKNIPGADGADYALFITTEDQYGSTGRKVAQIFAAFAGVGITSGVHKGFAGLVDLKTGDLVWLNADLQMGGDVRTPEGATRRVDQLLEDFPGKPVTLAAKTAE